MKQYNIPASSEKFDLQMVMVEIKFRDRSGQAKQKGFYTIHHAHNVCISCDVLVN